MTKGMLLLLACCALLPAPAQAQFASDFPAVPRAAIPITGRHQNRIAWTMTGYKVGNASSGDTIAAGLRLAFGQSYRIQSKFELGYDIALLDGYGVRPPSDTSITSGSAKGQNYMRALAGYGLRIGAKVRPFSTIDPEGNGYQLALGVSYQPQLKTLYGYEKLGDSSRSGGQFNSVSKTSVASFNGNPLASLRATTALAAMGSFRATRLMVDVALVQEIVSDGAETEEASPLTTYRGFSVRAGGAFRLTPGIAVGGSYWGNGSPPWSEQIRFSTPGKPKDEQFGVLLQFGRNPESGVDLMYSAPTGHYGESGRLYIRSRSTH